MCVWVCVWSRGKGREVVIREERQRVEKGESKEGSPFTLCMYLLRAT